MTSYNPVLWLHQGEERSKKEKLELNDVLAKELTDWAWLLNSSHFEVFVQGDCSMLHLDLFISKIFRNIF